MEFITNFGLLIVGIVTAAIGMLGFVLFLNNPKSITNKTFFLLSIATILWNIFNYLLYQFNDPVVVIWLLRISVFFAVWYAYFVFQLFFVFPNSHIKFSKLYKFVLIPVVAITSLFNLSPLVFTTVAEFSTEGRVSKVINGPVLPLFGLVVIFLIFSSLYILYVKYKKSKDNLKFSLSLILLGSVITYLSIIVFNFIFPAIFDITTYVPYGGVLNLPFIAFSFYAIAKHRFLNIRIITTEILVFVLIILFLFDIIISVNITQFIFKIISFIIILFFSLFLIKSVRKEIEQREKLEHLTKELQSANERLKQLDEAKTEFLSITSHQLRTPLSAIKGYLSMLQEGDFGKMTKKQTDIVGILLRNSERLIRLINIFLNISRIESGRLKINKSLNDINRLLDDIIKSLAIEAGSKHIKVEFRESDVPLFQYDNDKIADVLINLIDNAIKYTPIGGWVKVSVKNMDKYILVKVQDNGKGISYEEIDQLFQKFKRGKDINRVDTSGVGLGLYIAKKIIEGHGGNVWAESEGENKGTSFKFTLPLE